MQNKNSGRTAATMVYARLREAILCGALLPGEKLGIDAVVERFGAGATPVREALNRLASEGLVAFRDLRGFSVADLDEAELRDLYKARTKYFAFLLREAIENGNAEWEERVIVAFHRLSKTPWSTSEVEFKLNPDFTERLMEFYAAIFAGCGSRRLVDFAVRLHQECNRFFWMVMESKFETNEPESMHKSLVDAVVARDTERAVHVITTLNERLEETVLKKRATLLAVEKRAVPRSRVGARSGK